MSGNAYYFINALENDSYFSVPMKGILVPSFASSRLTSVESLLTPITKEEYQELDYEY